MNLSFSYTLGNGRVSGIDPDAKAYIAAVITAGATVTPTQQGAINTFIKTGKSDGWYSSIKRLYLPIWAAAAPNAIDMIGLTSGTFVGVVTHTAGYAQGNGSTGYFDSGVALPSVGISNSSGYICTLTKTGDSRTNTVRSYAGAEGITGFGTCDILMLVSEGVQTSVRGTIGRQPSFPTSFVNGTAGIHLIHRIASSSLLMKLRTTVGVNDGNLESTTVDNITALSFPFMAYNSDGSMVFHTNAEFGVFSFGTSMGTDSSANDFTLALKNLWETCTGLTLP